jgi:hypothetical protein
MKDNYNHYNKEMMYLFHHLYTVCIKYKIEFEKQQSDKKIDCRQYYITFKQFYNNYTKLDK